MATSKQASKQTYTQLPQMQSRLAQARPNKCFNAVWSFANRFGFFIVFSFCLFVLRRLVTL